MTRYQLSAIGYRLIFATTALCAGASVPLCAQADPRLVAAVQMAREGQGDSARAVVKRILDATPAAQPLYAEAVYTAGVVAGTAAEMERQFQRMAVEFNGSAWSDDALLKLVQLNFARGDLAAATRTAERLSGDYPQSEVIPEAALWAARAYFRTQNTADGCRWLKDGLARADTLDVELRNGLVFLNGRCGTANSGTGRQVDSAPPVTPARSDSVTRPPVQLSTWSVQIASSSTPALANDAVAKLGRDGFPGGYVVPDGAVFKVRVGKLPARSDADALLARVRAKYPSAFVVEERP
jgi:hypothetical protein